MRNLIFLFIFQFCFLLAKSQPYVIPRLDVKGLCTEGSYCFVDEYSVFTQAWDTLSQIKFWRRIISMPSDSGILSVGSTRETLSVWSQKDWDKSTEDQKKVYRDSIKCARNMPDNERIFFTNGKKEFYDFDGAIPLIDKGTQLFVKEKTDPFYAQAILLIESPGRVGRSPVGAVGSFQLMKSVAKQMGLTVNSKIDERKDFERSAWASAKLIRTVCIPYAESILKSHNIKYDKSDLWFRLIVLHIYHAGAGNVRKAVDAVCPEEGGNHIITNLWTTKVGGFANASQNYSQIALATMVELSSIIERKATNIQKSQYKID